MKPTRELALTLLHEYTISQSLIRHALCVEASMRWYANFFSQPADEIELWGITGLLHDFDYEKYPDPVAPDGHPYKGNAILEELGYPESIRNAIMGHALYTNVPRDTLMARALFAVDELSGFVYAASLVRPDKSLLAVEVKSVLKKMKDKAFARGCCREDMILGAQELGIPLDEHVGNVIKALQGVSETLS